MLGPLGSSGSVNASAGLHMSSGVGVGGVSSSSSRAGVLSSSEPPTAAKREESGQSTMRRIGLKGIAVGEGMLGIGSGVAVFNLPGSSKDKLFRRDMLKRLSYYMRFWLMKGYIIENRRVMDDEGLYQRESKSDG